MIKWLKWLRCSLISVIFPVIMVGLTSEAMASLTINQPNLADMLEKAMPAIVNIRSFHLDTSSKKKNHAILASGVIIDADKGLIVTNDHVVDGNTSNLRITLSDQRSYYAKVLGEDAKTDIALLQIKADHLTALNFASSVKARVGDTVLAIGNPFGLDFSVTKGIISALGRGNLGIEAYENFIQTDAAVNPGNSGGALINTEGELLGINTALVGTDGGNLGIGFAIPVDMVRAIIDQLLHYGYVNRGVVGIQVQNLSPDLAKAFDYHLAHGALLTDVFPKSPADKAGLEAGDVITKINQMVIANALSLQNRLAIAPVGVPLKVTFYRNQKPQQTTLISEKQEDWEGSGGSMHPGLAGAILADVEQYLVLRGQTSAVAVLKVQPGSLASRNGLRAGELIVDVNKTPVHNLREMRVALSQKSVVALHVLKDQNAFYIILQTPLDHSSEK